MSAARPAIHQFVAGFSRGDAISNEALCFQRLFRQWGHPAGIFCEAKRILPELRGTAQDLSACTPDPAGRDILLLHLSIGSPVNDRFAELPGRKAILYHNVTPPGYFRGVNPRTAALLEQGRRQAASLAGRAEVNLADSRYNAAEMEAWGYAGVRVLPLVLDLSLMEGPRDRAWERRLDDGRTTILFVGRGAPNKRVDELLTALAYLRRGPEPGARLLHVGSWAGAEPYQACVLARARELDLQDDVVLAGSLPLPALNACYAAAHVFLCLSEHEGFCIPLIEAMTHNLPVVALARGAVAETMDGAGVLLHRPDYACLAELLHRLRRDDTLREAVRAGQRERIARYRARDLAAELKAHLHPLLAS